MGVSGHWWIVLILSGIRYSLIVDEFLVLIFDW